MPALAYLFLGICLAYGLAAMVGMWRLKQLGYQRFLPLGPIVVTVLFWLFLWLPLPGIFGAVLAVLSPLFCIGCLYVTLRITWSEPDPAARVLRVTSATFLGYALFFLLTMALPAVT